MKPQRYLNSYKCDCFQPDNFCICGQKNSSSDALLKNITDTAESLIEIMNLCGIKQMKRQTMLDIIIHYFLHFEEVLHCIDSIPRKRFNKEDLLHDLGRKCGMIRRESQMAFSIIKRAFRAFYYGTGQGGVPYRFKDKLTHSSECLWVHAAQRTAAICACYEGMFYANQKDLECKIKLIYKQLYDRITARSSRAADDDDDNECKCIKCTKRIKCESLNPKSSIRNFHATSNAYEALFLREQEKLMEEEDADISLMQEKIPCSCPSLSMTENDYKYRNVAENIDYRTTQGPFECRWFSISKEEYDADENAMNIQIREDFPCYPSQSTEECGSECECVCEDYAYEVETNSDVGDEVELEVEIVE